MKHFLLILSFCISLNLSGRQTILFDGERIGSNTISSICQDNEDYIWLGTKDGLIRFDGSRFIIYEHNVLDDLSLADNDVCSLLYDDADNLWIGTLNGLQKFNKEQNCFNTIRLYNTDTKGRIADIIKRKNGEIIFAVSGIGLFHLETTEMTGYKMDLNISACDIEDITDLFEDSWERLWIATKHNQAICIDDHDVFIYDIPEGEIKAIIEDQDQRLFVVSEQTIFLINEEMKSLQPLPHKEKKNDYIFSQANKISTGDVVIGTEGNGTMIIRNGKDYFEDFYLYNSFAELSISIITTLFEDHENNLWIGCRYQGLIMLPSSPLDFSFIKYPIDSSSIPSMAQTLYCDSKGRLWCPSCGQKLLILSKDGQVIKQIPTNGTVGTIYEDNEGSVWIGVNGKGLYVIDNEESRLKLIYPIDGNYVISSIAEDSSNTLFASIMGKGIFKHCSSTNKMLLLDDVNEISNSEEFINFWITSIFCDSQQRIWTTHNGGISCYDQNRATFLKLPLPKWDNAYCITEDNSGLFWIGTRNGLIRYNTDTEEYKTYTTVDGLSSNIIYNIIPGNDGCLWCSTSKGITRISLKNEEITSYYTGNGLEDYAYNERCGGKDINGIIYFGGTKGITSFNPMNVSQKPLVKAPRPTDIYVNNRKIAVSGIENRKTIHLSASENNILLYVSAKDFRDSDNIIYEYRIDGYDRGWNHTQPRENKIQYHNLPSGKHRLEIRSNKKGISSPISELYIDIRPVWYFSILARIVYAFILSGICILIYIAYKRKQNERESEMKLQYFINIAHELRSPLTLIINPLNKLLAKDNDEDSSTSLTLMRTNVERILNLLNQILDIRKIDKGLYHLSFTETEILPLVERIVSLYSDWAEQKDIIISSSYEENLPLIWLDPDNFEKILCNLISNALKYTPEGGNIMINVRLDKDNQDNIRISVSDSGKGLDEKEIVHLFERFYQGNANTSSSGIGFGIGLHLCRHLAELHHGSIHAANRSDSNGSTFTVILPIKNDHVVPNDVSEKQTAKPTDTYSRFNGITEYKHLREHIGKKLTPYRLLIVEDNESLSDFIKDSLSDYYLIDVASSGKEGLRMAVANHPDAIVSDVVMPEMNGLSLLKSLKSNAATSSIPIILLTSRNDICNKKEGLAFGADAYINKPFDIDELKITISNLIANRLRIKGNYSGNNLPKDKMVKISVIGNDDALMETIMRIINTNLNNHMLNVEFLANEVGISRTHLYRKVKEITGLSISDFIRNQRLYQASILLKEGKINVTQIAYEVGFTSQSHFSTLFKKQFGISPSEYMESQA